MDRLKDKVAIVTGAASGIGRASAELFAAEGARVLAVDRPGTNLGFDDKTIETLACDISGQEAPKTIIGRALEAFGRLDILYNNAGIGAAANVADMTDEQWDRVQDVDLRAVFRVTREAIPHLVKSPAGRIISTASVMALGTDFGLASYCAAKAGILGLTRTLALELGKQGVTANAVLPGAIQTGMTAAGFADPKAAEVWAKK